MEQHSAKDRAYYAQRAAEELELAQSASDESAAEAHRKLQRAYLERASVGDRESYATDPIG
jgi:CRISPR/Cas system-associated protein Cas5 (RAMP superfamily)